MRIAVEKIGQRDTVCELGNQRFTAGQGTTKEFYESLGYKEYVALDINTRMNATIVDLNYPVDVGQYDLVTSNGDIEHIFDQRQVFENIHNATKVDGVMLHIVPWIPWLNHGFYNLQPIIFEALSRTNNYEILFFWIGDRFGKRYEVDEDEYKELFREKFPKMLEQVILNLGTQQDLSLVCVMKKTSDNPFRIPLQKKYLKDIENEEIKKRYG